MFISTEQIETFKLEIQILQDELKIQKVIFSLEMMKLTPKIKDKLKYMREVVRLNNDDYSLKEEITEKSAVYTLRSVCSRFYGEQLLGEALYQIKIPCVSKSKKKKKGKKK